MSKRIEWHGCTPARKNKTGTTLTARERVVTAKAVRTAPARRCGYVVAGGATPFCDRPALAGSSYCAWHRARCAVAPTSADFAALAAGQAQAADQMAPPPAEFTWLSAPAPPEPFDESDDERLAEVNLPPTGISHDE